MQIHSENEERERETEKQQRDKEEEGYRLISRLSSKCAQTRQTCLEIGTTHCPNWGPWGGTGAPVKK